VIAAIVSAGPSARSTWGDHPAIREIFDEVVAINSVAACEWLGRYDWWHFGDQRTLAQITPHRAPSRGILTMDSVAGQWEGGGEIVRWSDATEGFPSDVYGDGQKGPNWTIHVALWWLYRRGYRRVAVFGHDQAGTVDVAGRDTTRHRTPDRWKHRRRQWRQLTEYLTQHGVVIMEI